MGATWAGLQDTPPGRAATPSRPLPWQHPLHSLHPALLAARAHFTEGKPRPAWWYPPLLWATTSQMGSKSETLRWLNRPRGCSSVKVDWVSVPARAALESWGT